MYQTRTKREETLREDPDLSRGFNLGRDPKE